MKSAEEILKSLVVQEESGLIEVDVDMRFLETFPFSIALAAKQNG